MLNYIRCDVVCAFISTFAQNSCIMARTSLSNTVKDLRKEYGLTQEDLALKSGVGLCFIRNLEQGKATLRMDKVNQLLDLFNYELTATPKD